MGVGWGGSGSEATRGARQEGGGAGDEGQGPTADRAGHGGSAAGGCLSVLVTWSIRPLLQCSCPCLLTKCALLPALGTLAGQCARMVPSATSSSLPIGRSPPPARPPAPTDNTCTPDLPQRPSSPADVAQPVLAGARHAHVAGAAGVLARLVALDVHEVAGGHELARRGEAGTQLRGLGVVWGTRGVAGRGDRCVGV